MARGAKVALAALVVLVCAALVAPSAAYALSPKIYTPTKAENTAYNRCVKAAMSYKSEPQTITVNIKDLKLTMKQVKELETRIHSNGELWWINTFGLGLSTKEITMPCKYSDKTINSMRKKFEKAVKKALTWIGPGMTDVTKVHMLHDYLIRKVAYEDHCKNAYEALVNKRADCFGYALGTDVLLRRAGFKTDVAFNNRENVDHSWNLVKVGSYWYHVDTTWDRFYTYEYYKGDVCHKWLMQSDKVMGWDEHAGWEAHNRCSDSSYEEYAYQGGVFSEHCNDRKNIVRSFGMKGLKYKVTAPGKVSVAGATASGKKKASLKIPATVEYKNVTYTVSGIGVRAFANAKAETLLISSKSLSKARVKDSLKDSSVKTVKVLAKKYAKYRKCFAKGNCGKRVKVRKASASALSATAVKLVAA